MARRHGNDFDRVFNFARTALFVQPLSDPLAAAMDDDGLAIDPDEPPDSSFATSPQSYTSVVLNPQVPQTPSAQPYTKKVTTPMTRQSSLLTESLLTATSLKDVPASHGMLMMRAGSQASAYSLTSNHGLTSDGGMSSPARTGTPSPPLPPAVQTGLPTPSVPKSRTIKFAAEKTSDITTQPKADTSQLDSATKPRKTCISFACAPVKPAVGANTTGAASIANVDANATDLPKRPCTIKFACAAKPSTADITLPKPPALPAPKVEIDMQTTPKPMGLLTPSRRARGSQSTIVSTDASKDAKTKVTSGEAVSPTEVRKLGKKKTNQITGIRPEDEAWMNDEPKPRRPITVSDTLRKENAIRKLAEEASQEIDEEYDIDDIVDEEDDEDLPATGSRYMAFDEDESDGGHETDDEEGFAASDDESDDDPDFQFWTAAAPPAVATQEQPEMLRPHHHRTASDSSLDSHLRHDSSAAAPKPFFSTNNSRRRRSPKEAKMRPGTPELPDSTDFVCGTLDEDRPLEEAYLSCLKLRKLEKRGIIPQDLDPSFPTSDPENVDDDEEDEVTEGMASTASDHHFLGGRFDESDASQERGRVHQTKTSMSHRISPRRLHSPAPKTRVKSPAPTAAQRKGKSPAPKLRAKSPAPVAIQRRARSPAPQRKLFARSPLRAMSPAPAQLIKSPPASPKGITFKTRHLAQRHTPVRTASLPHTPNPFFVAQERRMRARAKKQLADSEAHNRGPIDIKQGLEARKQRRKEHYWRKHCRDHKDKSRRCAPGKGAERMRELGLEMAHRNKAYGQKLQLMLSV